MAQAGDSVTGALDKTASGIGSAGDGLASAMGSAIRGLTSGAGGLFGGGDGGGGGGYAYGGYTGDGGRFDPAGIVHRGEYVFSASAVDRIGLGVLDVWHRGGFPGYDKGGYVTPVSLPPMAMLAPVQAGNSNAAPIVNHTIINQSGAQVETRESRGPNGEINMETFIRHAGRRLAGEMTDGRGALRRAVQNEAQGGSAALVG